MGFGGTGTRGCALLLCAFAVLFGAGAGRGVPVTRFPLFVDMPTEGRAIPPKEARDFRPGRVFRDALPAFRMRSRDEEDCPSPTAFGFAR
jgi:hypothetical protein